MESTSDWVFRRLRAVPGLEIREAGPDRIEVLRRGSKATLHVRPHARLGSREVEGILRQRHGRKELLATRALGPAVRDTLARAHLSWVERETGVVHLDTGSLFVHVEPGTPTPQADTPRASPVLAFGGVAGVLAEVLLEEYRGRPFTLREAAERVHATKGRVSQVFSQWVAAEILAAEGRTRTRVYELRAPGRLLDGWAGSGVTAPEHRTGLFAWSRTPADLYPRLRALDAAGISWAVGGMAAAHAYAPTLSALPAPQVWVQASVPAAEVAHVLDADVVGVDEKPNLVLWQTEGDPALVLAARRDAPALRQASVPLVSRPRAYAEARAAGGRGVDVAEALREEMGL